MLTPRNGGRHWPSLIGGAVALVILTIAAGTAQAVFGDPFARRVLVTQAREAARCSAPTGLSAATPCAPSERRELAGRPACNRN